MSSEVVDGVVKWLTEYEVVDGVVFSGEAVDLEFAGVEVVGVEADDMLSLFDDGTFSWIDGVGCLLALFLNVTF